MKAMNCMVVAMMVSSGIGCASLPRMDADDPIEIDSGPFGPRYKQDGQGIDPSDMADQLDKEPEATSDVSRSQGLRIVALLLGAAGGALIGVPLGQAAGGERDPLWPLAGAGAGAVALSIPATIWAVSSMDSAVEAHNQALRISGKTAGPSGARSPSARAGHGSRSAQLEAFGFVFGPTK